MHCGTPTDVEAMLLEFISPAGFEGFLEEICGRQEGASPEAAPRSALGTD